MISFDKCQALFDADDMEQLASSESGLLWLKIKSVSRKHLLEQLWTFAGLRPLSEKTSVKMRFKALYEALSMQATVATHDRVDRFIRENAPMPPAELENIASELHKMQNFSWGGDYSNALDKYLVDRYIKKIHTFDGICGQLQTEIPRAVEGYVLCSWYNHWTTILIEHVFRQHGKVLPAIGRVKKVDFFVDNIPFDLKTTYLPANFVEQGRKEAGLVSELVALKRAAKESRICYDRDGRPKDIAYEIAERIKVEGDEKSRRRLAEISNFRKQVLRECQNNPLPLITNLYEQQGEMRFDASNRLFVVLADLDDFDGSWKLKRNPSVLRGSIHTYLDRFSKNKVRRVTFSHKAKSGEFSAMSDVIFVVAENCA